MSMRGFYLIGASSLALVACAQVAGNLPRAPEVPDVTEGQTLQPYRIQVGDVLDVRLMLNPELNEEVTVRPDGHISTTVVRDQKAAGRTVQDLTTSLIRDYSHDLRNPRLTVEVKSFSPTRIYVGGEVAAPGEFISAGPSLTLSQAIARAGGMKNSGDEGNVFIIRRVGDTAQYYMTGYNDVMHARDPHADVQLASYDVVYVPRTGIAEAYRWYNQAFQQWIQGMASFGASYIIGGSGAAAVVTQPTATVPVTPATR
jgi:polysaccharide export outer membrane protein